MLPIVEIFSSIQGEGARIVPAVFVRSALCNFQCQGFNCKKQLNDGTIICGCDTIKAASTHFKDQWSHYTSHEDLINDIDAIMPRYSRDNILKPDLIWTGGEPIIHWKNDVIQRTLSHYISRDHKTTIESNGSLDVEFNREYQRKIIFSLSIKLANSGESEHKRINLENITRIVEYCPNSYLKFVVSEETWDQDWEEIRRILKSIPIFVNVFLMPMGENRNQIHQNTKFVFQKCIDLGFMYSDRLHIRAFDNQEGV